MIRVLFVCLGNICRSPLGHGLFEDYANRIAPGRYVVDSAGTSAYHVGEPPCPGSIRIARKHGVDISGQRSRQLKKRDFDRYDFIVAMDRSNLRNIKRVGDLPAERLFLLRDFDDQALHDFDVPDPWGSGAPLFDEVYAIISRSIGPLFEHMEHHGPR